MGHIHYSVEDLLLAAPCSLHDKNEKNKNDVERSIGSSCGCPVFQDATHAGGVNLLVTGSPCNPFSTRRAKRFADGNVASHCLSEVTFESVVQSYVMLEPKTGVTEQVKGFDQRISSSNPETPLDQRLGSTFGRGGNRGRQKIMLVTHQSVCIWLHNQKVGWHLSFSIPCQ